MGTLLNARIALLTCHPSMSGIIRSRSTTLGFFSLTRFNAFRAAVGRNHFKAMRFEQHAHQFGDGQVIVNYKYFCWHIFFPCAHYA